MGEKEKLELDSNENAVSYSTSMALDWRLEGAKPANSSVGLVPRGDLIGSSSCSYASMVDSYGPNFLDHPPNSGNLGFCDINVQTNSNTDGVKAGQDNRTLGMGWSCTPASSMMKRDAFLPNEPGIFPQGLSQFAIDSGFVECAARFSCFSNGNFGDMVNSYGIPQSMALHARNGGLMLGGGNALLGHGLESAHQGQSQDGGPNVVEAAKGVSRSVDHLGTDGSPIRNDKRSDCPVMSPDEGKQAVGGSCNEDDGAESSGDDGVGSHDDSQMMDCRNGKPSIKGLNQKKRKRSRKDADSNKATGALEVPREAARDNCEGGQKGDQRPASTTKAPGKDAKQVFQPSDLPKEGYIHVRARRGQATNSHSLAERVRREKISERMKFLQDLVPGCDKVTSKAVMLDEIINYVQSLQRQVEFLSMKLAAVNPHMDFNIEGLLAKDIHQHQPGSSSALGFLREMSMAFPPLYPSQTGLIHSTLPKMANSPNILGQTIQPQLTPLTGGFKEPNLVNPLEAAKD